MWWTRDLGGLTGDTYGALCEMILDSATLHSSRVAHDTKKKRSSGVSFKERELELVKKAV